MPEPAPTIALRPPAWARSLEALPPSLRHRLAEALAGAAGAEAIARFAQLAAIGQGWFGAEPRLAELGHWMIGAGQPDPLRELGCRWLAQLPSLDGVRRLAQLALDDATPRSVRDQAIAALGARELRDHHPATRWPADAVQLADDALVRLAGAQAAGGAVGGAVLQHALRHVAGDGIAAVFAKSPARWAGALECFATAPLARVLAVSIDDIAPPHRLRVLRLVAATLGEEAIALLRARAPRAAPGDQVEMMLLAISLGGDAHLGALEDLVRGRPRGELVRERARWHLEHRGVVPTVRGLRVARTTATIAPAERAARCAQAADDLGALVRFERHADGELYTLWGWMVRGAGDPVRARALVAAHPASQALVGDLYLEDLARRGRVREAMAAAHDLGRIELAAYQLAIWGRPRAALALAQAAHRHTAELVCARALACYRTGRPDLTARILADDLPLPAPAGDAARILVDDLPLAAVTGDAALSAGFPGPDERWRLAHAAAEHPALAALVAGPAAVIALARPAPPEAEPDVGSLEPLAALDHLAPHLAPPAALAERASPPATVRRDDHAARRPRGPDTSVRGDGDGSAA